MRLVEIIPGLKTAAWVRDAMMTIGRRMTREPVLCTDSPAFLVNHVGRAFVPEAQRLLTENIAGVADIDRILTGAPGFRLGPFALADMVGIDIQHGVMESVYGLFYGEPMFTPFPVSAQRVAAGQLGQKTGAGWYRYENGKRIDPPLAPVPSLRSMPVWVRPSEHHADLQAPLIDVLARAGADIENGRQAEQGCADRRHAGRLGPDHGRGRPQARPRAQRRRRCAVRHEGPAHADGDAGHRSRHARCRARPARRRRARRGGDQRQPRLRRPARGRHDRQHRLRRGAAGHRHAGRHRQGHQARPRLSVRAARMGRPARRRPHPAHPRAAAGLLRRAALPARTPG